MEHEALALAKVMYLRWDVTLDVAASPQPLQKLRPHPCHSLAQLIGKLRFTQSQAARQWRPVRGLQPVVVLVAQQSQAQAGSLQEAIVVEHGRGQLASVGHALQG